ncbi:two-component system response regulator [Serinicoccus chungangensis]|uniref:Two-component system response regulator n=1 Tax=Serinicoccus chungangensis TaxID=767452 RepID=A0A0W8IB39_9MICO|nr:response regulator transcription factor [Serinicoccus chungangensis]KUG57093.1 two-component system response regulator [Serinicoccus chungangensis]
MATVVVVEDDDKIAAPLVRTLERDGHAVDRFDQGQPAVDRVVAADPQVDLVLLDLGLPDMDGIDVCRAVREAGYLGGIIILTARDGELDRVVGLDTGADDYLAKPFGLAELQARTRALLRRSSINRAPDPPRAEPRPADGGLHIDVDARRVLVRGVDVPTTTKEFDVLALLAARRGAVVSRETLINEVWDENWFGSTKTLDNTVGRLRGKLEGADAPVRITAVRGVGFRLETQDG